MTSDPPSRPRGLVGAPLAGLLLGAVGSVVVGFALDAVAIFTPLDHPAVAYRDYLRDGGWAWIPLWGAALGVFAAMRRAPGRNARLGLGITATVMTLLPLFWRPALPIGPPERWPTTNEEKIRASRRWSYRSLETVAMLMPLSRDADVDVRQHAVLALGLNRVVTDIEGDRSAFPSRYSGHPLRDSLHARLLECMEDPETAVRAEAARALWKAPRTFGPEPAAAETLAAILTRLADTKEPGRAAWLALDAAASHPHPGLKAEVRHFARISPDTALARMAAWSLGQVTPED